MEDGNWGEIKASSLAGSSFYLPWRMETASPELIPNRAAIFLPPTEDENKKE